ncbi:DUF6765 family protein [Chromobacterium violaceum]|uniref:DUF6765 family protein n=1 Tax=Chromobacterium violaceum TaxID=536 RepID=UPI001B32CFF1|nr:DUF6765 family protein [Chromobacterium violaceum]MBP4044539.1 hypothetical protein [Chromobacterium violaceum]
MDQDFHYYGTYYAARKGGFDRDESTLIAKSSNFIDFFSETAYAAYWELVKKPTQEGRYETIATLKNPRYTFQQGIFSTGIAPEDGLWCSFHFTPGNYKDPDGTPSREEIHGEAIAKLLGDFCIRDTNAGRNELMKYEDKREDYQNDINRGNLLNRPQSALSRQLIKDTIDCFSNNAKIESILDASQGGSFLLNNNRDENIRRFKLILLGIRSHVIADTWAHQDFCGVGSVLNTYWDVDYDPRSWNPFKQGIGRQSIQYNDGTSGWKTTVLSSIENYGLGYLYGPHPDLAAVPNGTSYLGHGWMGHFPDFSFVNFRYKPCWANPSDGPIERNNPNEYKRAWIELVSLFTQANRNSKVKIDEQFQSDLGKAVRAIECPCQLGGKVSGRKSSAAAWLEAFEDHPNSIIDVDAEPYPSAKLDGMINETWRFDRFGTNYVQVDSDLYLFQIAADYHFHFVKNYLDRHLMFKFEGNWSKQTSALDPKKTELFANI